MYTGNSDIINQLKREILPLEGLRSVSSGRANDLGLGFMSDSFPQGTLPLGAVHEFISEGPESGAATLGFTAGLLSGMMKTGGVTIWIGSSPHIFPPALKAFGIHPEHILFIHLRKEKDLLWTMEEALKSRGLAAVVGEIPDLNFTHSRRFQLAVEHSRVTGFILRSNSRHLQPNACVSRWNIKTLPSVSEDGLPGLGFPRWHVELQKIRNGKPGSWQVEWEADHFQPIKENIPSILTLPKRKTG